MFKKTFHAVGRVVKPFVNVRAWMGWESLKEDQARLSDLAKSVLTPEKARAEIHRESFEEAVTRLGLDESMILARQRYFKRLAVLYFGIAFILFLYAFYVLFSMGGIFGFLTALIAVWIALALGFKQHFWYTQMRVRRLGLSFREWFLIAFHIS